MCVLRAGILLLVFCFCAGAVTNADENKLQVGAGIVCDTSEQIQHYLTLYQSDTSPEAALQIVNSESHNPSACGMAALAFAPGDQVGTIAVPGGIMRIMQIIVVATQTNHGWVPVPAAVQYTAVFVEQLEV